MSYTDFLRNECDHAGRARVLSSVSQSTRNWQNKYVAMGQEGAHTAVVLKIAAECLEWAMENEKQLAKDGA